MIVNPAIAAPLCTFEPVAKLNLRDDGGYLSVLVKIGQQPVRMLVDTGAQGSLVTPEGARILHLANDLRQATRIVGADGVARDVPDLVLAGLTFGAANPLPALPVPMAPLPGSPILTPPVVGLLGADVLGRYDLEFDVPHGQLRLWDIRLGSAVCRRPPGWGTAFEALPLMREGGRLLVSVTLNNVAGRALLDSGARSRIVSTAFANRAGVGAEALARDPGGENAGVDLRARNYHWHRFAQLAVGAMVERGPVLTVAPLDTQADMLLGADWFASRVVWVSNAASIAFVRHDAGSARDRRAR